MKNPLISIVMPAYDVENFIAEAIESVLAQTYSHWELIVVDDGSKDRSADIAKSYMAHDLRIKVVSKPNGGLSDARNFGLKYASGQYVHFFDSDDCIDAHYYSDILESLDDGEHDIVISGFTTEHRNKENTIISQTFLEAQPIGASTAAELLKFIDFAWNKLFRRSFIEENDLKYEKGLYLIEDCEFMSRALSFSPRIIVSQCVGYHYIDRPRTTLSKMFDENTLQFMNRRVMCTQSILQLCGYEEASINLTLAMEKFSNMKFLFNLLFSSSEENKTTKIRKILSLPNMQKIDLKMSGLSIKDKMILFAIRHNMILFIKSLYSVKRIQYVSVQAQTEG